LSRDILYISLLPIAANIYHQVVHVYGPGVLIKLDPIDAYNTLCSQCIAICMAVLGSVRN